MIGAINMYKRYTKKQFEFLLRGLLIDNKLGFLNDVTSEHSNTWEYIYEVSTRNPSVKIIIFSSVDKRTEKTRDNGDDRVRLIMRWTNRKGEHVYKRLARHNRIDTLFNNVKSTLLNAKVFNLDLKEFSGNLPF
jgi:hypothetical protein